ncbi:hypothetical protein LCGC14_0823750 [marine sediment metagenome]|uniref:Uncharacterized protein n=1 Tax=marine sediment metagenome TaxID=412755 RepID=A0A0F9Q398_9ZZZZ|nr:hypothetical protein [Desulfobacterales bacterium]
MKIQRSKISVLIVIFKLIEKYHRSYCWPTRLRIKKLLLKYHDIDISIYAIDKHLKSLNDFNLIKSFRRFGQRDDGTLFLKPSNRQLTKKGVAFLISLGVKISKWLLDFVFQKNKIRRRFSQKKLFPSPDPKKVLRRSRISDFSTIGDILKTPV